LFFADFTGDFYAKSPVEYSCRIIIQQGFIPIYSSTQLTDALHKMVGFETDYEFITKRKSTAGKAI